MPENTTDMTTEEKKTLPLSNGDYLRALSDNQYIIDKSLLIKTVIDKKYIVTLFTRPRRFGKSFNLSMLRTFFEKTDDDTSVYFCDKKIWQCGEKYTKEQGKYPVIYLDFKDIEAKSWKETFSDLKDQIEDAYLAHPELLTSDKVDPIKDLPFYKSIIYHTAKADAYKRSLYRLSRMLKAHYKVPPVIIIDEYDTPIQAGYDNGYYDKIISFMTTFLSKTLKGNESNLKYAFITGVMRVAQESIFSGLNSIYSSNVLKANDDYGEFFGFTPDETNDILKYYGLGDNYPEVCEWYDGYRFGNAEIFNPWSVLMYIDSKGDAEKYWVGTSSNHIIHDLMQNISSDVAINLKTLMTGEEITVAANDNIVYNKLQYDESYIYTVLVHSGYLKPEKKIESGVWSLKIPNKEVYKLYSSEILSTMNVPGSTANDIQDALISGDAAKLKKALQIFMGRTISYTEYKKEYFHHVLLTGILSVMDGNYNLFQDIEAGTGKADILLEPKSNKLLPGIIIEVEKARSVASLSSRAKAAITQINEKQYDMPLKSVGCSKIYKVGAAFIGKDVEVIIE
ncbi:MAG: ATP-binding protein [Clostridia bacterium]|nr:ATP-binding protein [Clostridia bacterium]